MRLTKASAKLPTRHYFSTVPGAHVLYVVPPACCRCRWFETKLFDRPGDISFLYLDDADIAMGMFTDQIAEGLERILPFLPARPPFVQICFTCAFEIVGVDYDLLVEELEARFSDIRFLVFPIHHLSSHTGHLAPENRELSLYKGLRRTDATNPTVNILESTIAEDDSNELWVALRACGITRAYQSVKLTRYEDYQAMASSCLNLKVGRMGGPACAWMKKSLGIPWFHLPETYSVHRMLDGLDELCTYFGAECPDFSARANEVLALAHEAAAAFAGHPVIVNDSRSVDTIDLSAALMEYGFEVTAIESFFENELDNPLLETIRAANPDVKVYNTHQYENVHVTPATVVLSRYMSGEVGTSLFCMPTSHGADYGLARIEQLMRDMLAFAEREL